MSAQVTAIASAGHAIGNKQLIMDQKLFSSDHVGASRYQARTSTAALSGREW